MKKKLVSIFVVMAIAMVAGYNVYNSHHNIDLSNFVFANIEALANVGEVTDKPCGGPKENGDCQSTNTINCRDLSGCK